MPSKFKDFEEDAKWSEDEWSVSEDTEEHVKTEFNGEDDGPDFANDFALREVQWPNLRSAVVRPHIRSLAERYVPPLLEPLPLEERFVKQYEDAKRQLDEAAERKKKSEAKWGEALRLLAEEEAKGKGTFSKWSGNMANRQALLARLRREVDEAEDELKKHRISFDTLEASTKGIRSLYSAHQNCVKGYNESIQFMFDGWNKVYGPHTPVATTDKIRRFYGQVVKEELLPCGQTAFTFAPGADISRACRELRMGGHTLTLNCGTERAPQLRVDTAMLRKMDRKIE